MRHLRILAVVVLAGSLAAAAYLTLRGFDLLGSPAAAQVKEVPRGHQEIAFLMPATSSDIWERFVTAADALQKEWAAVHPGGPGLKVCKDNAFVALTADVAELALCVEGCEHAKLWIRWYKLSSATSAGQWIEALAKRDPPPLAVVGGDISDRALALAQALREARGRWKGAAPLLLLTMATADRYDPEGRPNQDAKWDELPKLMDVYKGRSFRFAFTNTRMASVVLDFVRTHPELWPAGARQAAAAAGAVAARDGVAGLSLLAAADHLQTHILHTLAWVDDSYSLDLANRFRDVRKRSLPTWWDDSNWIDYSGGDYYHPNPREALTVGVFLQQNAHRRDERRLLVLPTSAQRAQRVLRTIVRRDPLGVRNLVVITGDSISFNNVYRDRNVAWNIQDVPVPLLLFCHRNPTNPAVGFRPQKGAEVDAACSGTDDVLLYRDILEALVQSAYRQGQPLADADQLHQRLRQARWWKGRIVVPGFDAARTAEAAGGGALFDADGNRSNRTGEHVVWLRPAEPDALAQAEITVWRLPAAAAPGNGWVRIGEPLKVSYDGRGPG